jgi:hypothetical protein
MSDILAPLTEEQSVFTVCNRFQGISSDWVDVYGVGLACQFIVLTSPPWVDDNGERKIDVPDGEYTLEITTNPEQPDGPKARFDKHLFKEDNYGNNTIKKALSIKENTLGFIEPK